MGTGADGLAPGRETVGRIGASAAAAPAVVRLRSGDEAREARSAASAREELVRRARQQVARENHLAARQEFDPADARWMLARRAAESIEGGRAGVLPPEKRARLVSMAKGLGLRPFDAHLVIAIVQDGARTGEGALGEQPRHRLGMVRAAGDRLDGLTVAMRVLLAGLLGTGLALAMVGWVVAGG